MAVKTIHPSRLEPGMVVVLKNIVCILLKLIPNPRTSFKDYFIEFECLIVRGKIIRLVWDLEEDLVQIQV